MTSDIEITRRAQLSIKTGRCHHAIIPALNADNRCVVTARVGPVPAAVHTRWRNLVTGGSEAG